MLTALDLSGRWEAGGRQACPFENSEIPQAAVAGGSIPAHLGVSGISQVRAESARCRLLVACNYLVLWLIGELQ